MNLINESKEIRARMKKAASELREMVAISQSNRLQTQQMRQILHTERERESICAEISPASDQNSSFDIENYK